MARFSKLSPSFIFTIGNQYARQACGIYNAFKTKPHFHCEIFEGIYEYSPKGAFTVRVELTDEAQGLETFHHSRLRVPYWY